MEKYQSCILHRWKLLTNRQQLIPSQFIIFLNSLSETHCGCQWLPTENDLYWPTSDDQKSEFAMRQQNCIQSISSEFLFSLFAQVKLKQKQKPSQLAHLPESPPRGRANPLHQGRAPQTPRSRWFSLRASPQDWEPGSPGHCIKAPLGNFSLLWSNQGL